MLKNEEARNLLNMVYAERDSQQYLMDLSEGYPELEQYHKGKRDALNNIIQYMLKNMERV